MPLKQQNSETYYRESFSPDQYKTLEVIASAPSSGPPVLISGPSGTGKTHILTVAAHYLLQESVNHRANLAILVCTQQQSSADAYFEMYQNQTKSAEDIVIVRLAPSYDRYTKSVETFKKEMGYYLHHNLEQSNKRYLIITTCLTAHKMADVIPPGFFTHMFLDDGAQMREPEAVAPLCMAGPDTKIVIAGDKFQVGPQTLVLGEEPQEYGLAVSLLERLYNLYQELGDVAQSYCTHLSTNFRCHQGILDLACQVAYKLPLKSNTPDHLAHPDAPFPLRFVCTSLDMNVKETGDSVCRIEIDTALREASNYFLRWPVSYCGDRNLKSICFLSPCRAQVTVARTYKEGNLPPQVKQIQEIYTNVLDPRSGVQSIVCQYIRADHF